MKKHFYKYLLPPFLILFSFLSFAKDGEFKDTPLLAPNKQGDAVAKPVEQKPYLNKPQVKKIPAKESTLKDKKTTQTKKIINDNYKNYVWFGGGGHFLLFQQKPDANGFPVDYQSVGAPSLWSELRLQLLGPIGLRGEYHSQTLPNLKSSTVNLVNSKVNWVYSTVGLDYKINKYFLAFGCQWNPSIVIDYQSHSMPFLVQKTTQIYSIDTLRFNTISLGVYFDILSSKSWSYFWSNRLQFPLKNINDDTQIKSGISFDGSLGMNYHLNDTLAFGVFWGGQYHNYNYISASNNSGKYTLMTSKLNFLLGLFF